MTDFSKILDKAKELEAKMKEIQIGSFNQSDISRVDKYFHIN